MNWMDIIKSVCASIIDRRKARKAQREDRGKTRAIMDEWQVDRLNESIRAHHQGRNPTTRIDITELDKTHKAE